MRLIKFGIFLPATYLVVHENHGGNTKKTVQTTYVMLTQLLQGKGSTLVANFRRISCKIYLICNLGNFGLEMTHIVEAMPVKAKGCGGCVATGVIAHDGSIV